MEGSDHGTEMHLLLASVTTEHAEAAFLEVQNFLQLTSKNFKCSGKCSTDYHSILSLSP
jgi:hypothetical protein